MTWFPDLSPYSYFGDEYAGGLLAVGWLEGDHDYQRGDVPTKVIAMKSDAYLELVYANAPAGLIAKRPAD